MEDVSRWVNLGFVVLGLIIWWLLAHITQSVLELAEVVDEALLGERLTTSVVIGLVAAVIVTLVLWRNKKLYEDGLNIARELKKVTWPTWDETKSATKTVIVTTLIIAAILASFDFVFQKLTSFILGTSS